MEKRAIAITVGSIITMLLVAFLIWCTVLFWQNKNKIDTAYNDGYNAGIEDKSKLEIEITELKKDKANLTVALADAKSTITANNKTIESLTAQKTELQTQVTTLTATNETNAQEITRLSTIKTENENKINELTAQNATQTETINQHVATIATNDATIAQLQQENADCESEIETLQSKLNSANANKTELQQKITAHEATIEQNKLQISALQASKTELLSRIDDLTNSNTQNSATIANLQSQITSLNEQITQLTSTNNTNIATIAQLNTQIASLSARINELSALNVEQSMKMADLNSQVIKLTNYIQKYEQFLAGFESETQAIATFEFDGSLYAIQLVTNGGYASVTTPTSTEYVVFGGWTVNNEVVDIATYPVTQNTKFVAKVTYKYDVQFIADDNIISSQIVAKNATPNAVSAPTKTGYRFLGWSKDGVNVVDPTSTQITATTTFTALYIQQFTVRFLDGSNELKSQTVDKNAKATAPSVESTEHKIFNGWTINNAIVDVANYPITQNTNFVANFTYKYDVKYLVDDTAISTQLVVKDAYSTVPANPTKSGYKFLGWTVNGASVTPATYPITQNTSFVANWVQLHTVSFVKGDSVVDTQVIEHGKTATAPNVVSTDYEVFNGWTVDGNVVSPNEYVINANTNFVASFTYKYDVKFIADDNIISSQIVAKNATPTAVTAPTKTGYRFLGWSKDGVNVVDPTNTQITATTTFTALYIQQFTVRFLDDATELSSQTVDKNAKATAPSVESTEHKIFNGWMINNAIVDVANYPITQNTNFVANFTYKYDVKYLVDDTAISSQLVVKDAYSTVPANPTKEGFMFRGWSMNGVDVIEPTTIQITADTTFTAVWIALLTVNYVVDDAVFDTQILEENAALSAPVAPIKENKAFAGWSLDRYNVIDVTSYNLQADVTFYAVFVSILAGQWTGSCSTEGYSRSVTLLIFDSGLWLLTVINEDTSSAVFSDRVGFVSEANGQYNMTTGSISLAPQKVTLLENGSLQFVCSDNLFGPALTYIVTKNNIHVEQSYLVGFDKECTFNFRDKDYVFDVVFDGYSGTVPSIYPDLNFYTAFYVLYNNKLLSYSLEIADNDVMKCYCSDFELTDSSITLHFNTGTFN